MEVDSSPTKSSDESKPVRLEVSGASSLASRFLINGPGSGSVTSNTTHRISAPSGLLSRVKSFLPAMAKAQEKLNSDLAADPELRSRLDVENIDKETEDGSRVVEMNIGLMPEEDMETLDQSQLMASHKVSASPGSDWTLDSDPDSPASPPRPGQDNGFTSDSDSDSTISTSTGSMSSNEESPTKAKKSSKKSAKSHKRPQKRPLIQEIKNGAENETDESSDEERKRVRT